MGFAGPGASDGDSVVAVLVRLQSRAVGECRLGAERWVRGLDVRIVNVLRIQGQFLRVIS